jgi:hypothetical protein
MDPDFWLVNATMLVGKFGLSVIPMGEDKCPSVKWKEYQTRLPRGDELVQWPRHNIGIVTGSISNLVVVDCESREDAEWFWKFRGKSPVVVQSRRGFHFYFSHPGEPVRNAVQIDNRYDVRGDGGYVVAPPSSHSEGKYKWVKKMIATSDLPRFNPEWRPKAVYESSDNKIKDAVSYISRITAVSGEAGHDSTFRAVKTLQESGLSEGEALLAIQDWNRTNASPPWSDKDLLHKIRSVYSV